MKKSAFLYVAIICFLAIACKKNTNEETAINFTADPLKMGSCEMKFTHQIANVTSVEWDFGDGTAKSTESSPVHKYVCPGDYSVKLTVTIDGNTSSETKTVTVDPTTFKTKFSSATSEFPSTVVRTADMGYAIFGSIRGDQFDLFYFVKTDCSGKKIWEKIYPENRGVGAGSMCQTTDGGYALLGIREQEGSSNTDLYLVKIDSLGNKEWERNYGGIYREDAGLSGAIKQTSDGGYVVLGSTADIPNGGDFNFYLVKTNAIGQLEWEKTYGGVKNDLANSVLTTSDGGYLMLGQANGKGAGGADLYLVKVNSSGDMEWDKTFGGANEDIGYSLEHATGGGYVLLGTSQKESGSNNYDMYLVKTNTFGEKEWESYFDAKGYEAGNSVKRTQDGGYILIGYTNGSGAGDFDFYLVKTNSKGIDEWRKTYGETTYDAGVDVVQTSDCDGYALVGTQFFSIGLIKTDKNGNVK